MRSSGSRRHGQRSLNDFCRKFHGGESGPPKVVPYTFDDVVRTLNEVAPYDWASLLRERVPPPVTHAPLGGIERGGWKLVYNDKPNLFTQAEEKLAKFGDFSYSLGFTAGKMANSMTLSWDRPPTRRAWAGHEVDCRQWAEVVATRAACGGESRAGKRPADRIAGGECAVFQDLFRRLSRWREESAPGTGFGSARYFGGNSEAADSLVHEPCSSSTNVSPPPGNRCYNRARTIKRPPRRRYSCTVFRELFRSRLLLAGLCAPLAVSVLRWRRPRCAR